MDGFVILSHGSVLCGADRSVMALAERVRALRPDSHVEVGFLNYSDPPVATAIERVVAAGCRRIVIGSYFLVAGKFVVDELPTLLSEVRSRHPEVDFSLSEPLGSHSLLADAVADCATRARPVAAWRDALASVTERCRRDPRCPLYGGEFCKSPSLPGVAP